MIFTQKEVYMRHSLALIAMSLLVGLTACGSLSQYSDASRFQDGIYYKATDEVAFVPKSEEDFKQDAILKGLGSAPDTLTIIADQVNVYTFDPFMSSWWTFAPLSYRWWYRDAFYWGYYPYGMYSSWYDPFYYDSWYWGYPYYNPYHHHHYDWAYRPPMYGHPSNTVYTRRSGSATSGVYSRPSSSPSGNRSAVSSGSVRRATVSRGAKTTSRSFSESFNDNSATRRSSSASYDSSRGDTYRRSSGSSTYRSGSSSMGSYRSSGGFSGGGSSHSSGGSSMSRGGRR